MIAHVVGNNIGSARGNYIFYRDKGIALTPEVVAEMKRLRDDSIKRLEEFLEKGRDKDEDMLKFMDLLRASDWSTEELLSAFKKDVYDPFEESSPEGARELRDRLFKRPLR